MLVEYKTIAKNAPERSGMVTVDSRRIFNFDAFTQEHTKNEQEFLNTISNEWKRVPDELLDLTTSQNFICKVRLPQDKAERIEKRTEDGKIIIDSFE